MWNTVDITSIVLLLEIICVLTLYSKAPAGYPAGLRIVSINSTSITFAWNKPHFRNHITGYFYKFYLESRAKWGNIEGWDNVVVTFNNLQAHSGKTYTCGLRVAFMNSGGFGPFSPAVHANYTLPITNIQSRGKCIPIFGGLFSTRHLVTFVLENIYSILLLLN